MSMKPEQTKKLRITAMYTDTPGCDCGHDGLAILWHQQHCAWLVTQSAAEPVPEAKPDPVNHPPHYTQGPVEVIEITEGMNFCLGNAVKYILRCDHKGNPIQDLEKATWYIQREIQRRKKEEA